MILKRYYLGCLAHASYLIADRESGVAAVVDPQRDVDGYLEDARALGVEIRHVLLTHFHADFLAGHLELRARTGARIHLGARAQAEFDFTPQGDGDRLDLGPLVRLGFLETPGHTPEGVSILVFDLERSDREPHAVLTGDTLFLGDVGRPDLMASVGISAEDLASMLYDSLHQKLLKLPDETLVYPAHGAGSLCGKALSDAEVSTLGDQRRTNPALRPMTRGEFVALVTREQPAAPAYFGYDAALNKRERATLADALERSLVPLGLDELIARVNAGAQLLDVRSEQRWTAGHLRGAVWIGLEGRFATWAGTVLDPWRPIVLVAAPGTEREAALRLGRIGFDRVLGFLQGGEDAWRERPELTAASRRHALGDELPADARLVDVRSVAEFEAGHLEGAVCVPLQELVGRVGELPRDRPLALVCESGYRSTVARSLLERAGLQRVADLAGGMAARRAGAGVGA